MQALSGGPNTPIEQVTELGDGIIQKLVAAGITTVESLADMTPEQLEEIPGIGEKTLERSALPFATTSATSKKVKIKKKKKKKKKWAEPAERPAADNTDKPGEGEAEVADARSCRRNCRSGIGKRTGNPGRSRKCPCPSLPQKKKSRLRLHRNWKAIWKNWKLKLQA